MKLTMWRKYALNRHLLMRVSFNIIEHPKYILCPAKKLLFLPFT